jgi:hypothetical protein
MKGQREFLFLDWLPGERDIWEIIKISSLIITSEILILNINHSEKKS